MSFVFKRGALVSDVDGLNCASTMIVKMLMQYVHTVADHFCRVTGANKCPTRIKSINGSEPARQPHRLHFTFDLTQMKNEDDDEDEKVEDDGCCFTSNNGNNEIAALIVATQQQAFDHRVPCAYVHIPARESSEQLKNT